MIVLDDNMLEYKSQTCKASGSHFKGITYDFELNNGQEYFYPREIEVYQVLFN